MGANPLAGGANPLFFIASVAFGRAIGPILVPAVKDLENFAWSEHRVQPLSAETAAAMVVEGVWDFGRADTEASYTGVSTSRLEALRQLIDDPPDLATLYALWRRDLITAAKFREALQHHRLETDYFDALVEAHNVLLTPETLAAARVKGHVTQARQYSESNLQGITDERAEILYQTTGNPPGPETLQQMFNRNIIGRGEFTRGILQGNIRPEWDDELFAMRERLLTPAEVVNLRLRGWHDDAWMYEHAAELGLTRETTHDLFLGQGRPISQRQVFIGERRGGVYDGPTGAIDPPFLKSLQESNIRPEWYNLAWAQRHSLPSAFVIRGLAQSGDIDATITRQLLEWLGWPEFLIDPVVTSWTGGTTTTESQRVESAITSAVTEIRNAFILGNSDEGAVRGWLGRLDLADDADGLINVWTLMREVPQKGLTAAQVKKAFRGDPALHPRTWAIAQLMELGYTADDAAIFLDE